MSSKDNDNKNSQQLFSEDITKRLVKNILDDNPNHTEKTNDSSDFNIEYEEYDNEQFEDDFDEYDNEDFYDEEYFEEYEEYTPRKTKQSSSVKEQNRRKTKQNTNENNYRRNIEKYGKEFFDDEYDEYDDNSPSIIGRVISFSIIIVLTISTAFLAVTLTSTKKELTEAKAQIQELLDSKADTETKLLEESLKNEIDTLKKENEDLKSQLNPQQSNNTTSNKTEQSTKPSNTSNNNNSNSSNSSEYIVKEGDVIWNISKNVYGDGSHYQKILEANGLTENSVLKPGQKLIIPKIN